MESKGAETRSADSAEGDLTLVPTEPTHASWRLSLAKRVVATDAVVLGLTMVSSLALRFGGRAEQVAGPPGLSYQMFAVIIGIAWWICLALFRTRDPRILTEGDLEYRRVARATVLMFGVLAIISVLFKWEMSRGFLAITFPLGLVSLMAGRHGWRIWLRRQRHHGSHISRVLVVGRPTSAERLGSKFNRNPSCGMKVTGVWVPDEAHAKGEGFEAGGVIVPLLGNEYTSKDAILATDADTVIVTDSEHLGPEGMRDLTWEIGNLDIAFMVSPNLVDISAPRMQLGQVLDEPFIHLQKPQFAEAGNAVKGFFDASLGMALLILTAPVILCAAIAIKITSPGPAFYFQDRIGRDGHPFRIIKLRSMRTDADQQLADLLKEQGKSDSPLFKIDNDPRITRVGQFLRRYSIDELPQLVNVIKGDMSLVGPRPQRDDEVSMYDHRAERRLRVRPGMTGLWQVSGRSDLTWEESIRLDLYYVENWSMTGDLFILGKTIRAVLAKDGAY